MEALEIIIILAIVCAQVYVFVITHRQIRQLSHFLNTERSLKLCKTKVPLSELEADGDTRVPHAHDADAAIDVSVIYVHRENVSELLRNVVRTINHYLRKNKGSAADFHLIKDIVERHCDAVDEEINHKLPVPIYLGLMGTVVGIIIGLWSLDFRFDPQTHSLDGELFVQSVSGLISGVKSAMICSLVGLAMTTVLSSWLYRGAKARLENQKNLFYDFIQTHLLPQLSRDAASTILALQANLERFNASFETNVNSFGDIMQEIHEAFDSQIKLQQELKNTDIAKVANLNSNVLVQLHKSMGEFERFTQYLGQMNTFVHQTALLTDSINDQLRRTDAVETVVKSIESNVKKNELVTAKLREFLERVDENKAVLTAAGEIDSTMAQAIDELRAHTQQQIESIRSYTVEATADLKELVNAERGHLGNLDKLANLDNLDRLLVAINDMRLDNKAAMGVLQSRIETMSNIMVKNLRQDHHATSVVPRWLRQACVVLFIVTCLAVIVGAVKFIFSTQYLRHGAQTVQALGVFAADGSDDGNIVPMSAADPADSVNSGSNEGTAETEDVKAADVKKTVDNGSTKSKKRKHRRRSRDGRG